MSRWYDNEKYMSVAPCGTYAVNMMRLVRDIFTKPDWDAIAKEAYEFAIGEGENPRIKSAGRPNQIMEWMWSNTNKAKGKTRGVNRSIGMKRNNTTAPKGASANHYGFSVHAGAKEGTSLLYWDLEVMLHEAVHVVQTYSYICAHIGGKRRPHDLMFNRMMLMMAKPYLGLTKRECNPFNMGYSVGKGYAPTKALRTIIKAMIAGERRFPKRILKHSVPVVAKTEPSEEEVAKKQTSNAKRQLKAIMKRNWEVGGDDCWVDELEETEDLPDCWREATAQVCNKLLNNDMHISCLTYNEATFFEAIYTEAYDEWNPYNWDRPTSPARERGLAAMEAYLNRTLAEEA